MAEISINEDEYPLHLAAANNRLIELEDLLSLSEHKIDERNEFGETPLISGLKSHCSDEIALVLINHGCNVNMSDEEGLTPLLLAVARDTCYVARQLIEKGAIVDAKGRDGFTALHAAVEEQRLDMLKLLLDQPKNGRDRQNNADQTPLTLSLQLDCDNDIVSLLIEDGCNVNIPDYEGLTPLHLAVSRYSEIITRKLIQNRADVNAKDKGRHTPLHRAIMHHRLINVQELLKHPDIKLNERNKYGETPFFLSLKQNCPDEMITVLLERGCNFNLMTHSRESALHIAIQRYGKDVAHELIRRGADVHSKDVRGTTPLHQAVSRGNMENICMLLYYGANPNEEDRSGRTPLGIAFEEEFYDRVCEHLIDYAVDFNERDRRGCTLLHKALLVHSDLALYMIENGADVNLMYRGEHCLSYSMSEGYDTSEVFEEIWNRIDVPLLLESRFSHDRLSGSILKAFIYNVSFPDDQYLKCFYMIFDSPYIEDFIEQYLSTSPYRSLIYIMFYNRSYSLEDRLKIVWVFLSRDWKVYFEDVYILHNRYGFDECVEVLLKHGCVVHSRPPADPVDFTLSKICYDNFDIYLDNDCVGNYEFSYEAEEKHFRRFFKANFNREPRYEFDEKRERLYQLDEVPSLLQLSRDAVRRVLYKNWCTESSFRVYQAISQLPVPSVIRDILFLKEPIYDVI